MNIKELSESLNLKPKTIYNLIAANKIPFRRISPKRVVFYQDEIDAWIKERGFYNDRQQDGIRAGNPKAQKENKRDVPLFQRPSVAFTMAFLIFAWLASFIYLNHRISANSSKDLVASLLERDGLLAKAKETDSLPANPAGDDISSGHLPASRILPLLIGIVSREEEDYASRSRALDIIKAFVNEKGVYRTLIDIMKNDPNELIRMKAASALIRIVEFDEVKNALLERLKSESHATIRFKILEAFEQSNDRELLRKINEILSQESDPDVINKKKQMLNNIHRAI